MVKSEARQLLCQHRTEVLMDFGTHKEWKCVDCGHVRWRNPNPFFGQAETEPIEPMTMKHFEKAAEEMRKRGLFP